MAVGDFYYLHFADEQDFALASAPPDPNLSKQLLAGGSLSDWKPLRFRLGKGIVTDYLANSFAIRLCSERLRNVIDRNRGEDDSLQWLPATVDSLDGKEAPYWVLHFPDVPNVLNVSRSVMAGPMIVKAFLDASLVNEHRVFSFPNESLRLIVAGIVRAAIEDNGCSGMKFSRVPLG